MRCLVTGGSGFIGSHVVDRLLAIGIMVRVFDIRRSDYAPNVDHYIGSILDLEAIRHAMNGVDVVFHLSAVADVRDVFSDPSYAENVNVRGTINVLEAARRSDLGRVIYGSTTWVYSDVDADVVDEDTPIPPPRHLYTAIKLAGEHYCRTYGELYGLHYTVLRYGIPYGPRARPGTVVQAFVDRVLQGEPIIIDGDGSQYRQFVYVGDLAIGNVLAMNKIASGKTYNLDGSAKVSIREIAETVRDIIGYGEICYGEPRPGDFSGKMVSSLRAKEELGWEPKISFRDGVERYVAWRMNEANASG